MNQNSFNFEYHITIPANTLQSSPHIETIPLTRGILHRFELVFPAGPNDLVFLQFSDDGDQVFPANAGGYYRGEKRTLLLDLFFYELKETYTLTVTGWSPGTANNHTITANFTISTREILAGLW